MLINNRKYDGIIHFEGVKPMLEKEVAKENLVKIKKQLHTSLSETMHLGIADKCLINKVVDEVYEANFRCNLSQEIFLARVETELLRYKF